MMKKSWYLNQSSIFLVTLALISFSLLKLCGAVTYSNIDLSKTKLDPQMNGFMISGDAGSNMFGYQVSTAGDINKDGYDDIILGDHGRGGGEAYVIFGGENSALSNSDLATLKSNPTTPIITITAGSSDDYLGCSVNTAGDIDNDGYDDIMIGANGVNGYAGAVYVIYGAEKSSLSNIDLSTTTLNPATTGFMITGNAAWDRLGNSVSTAGDINNDGYDDIIIGSMDKNMGRGAVYIIYGGAKSTMSNIDLSTTTLDPATTGFMILGAADYDSLGRLVGAIGDIDHDGYDDIILGTNTGSNVYVIYGGAKSSMANIDFSTTNLNPASNGFMITYPTVGSQLGSVSTAGDINKDGYDDIIIGAPGSDNLKGAAYVIYGGQKSSMSNIDLSTTTLNPATTGFKITGNSANDRLGLSVKRAGDINKDGYSDIIIGASLFRKSHRGAFYVIYGKEKSSISNVDLSKTTLDPAKTGFMISGNTRDFLGEVLSPAGDINKDGHDDILIGVLRNPGFIYVIHPACPSCPNPCPANCNQCSGFPSSCQVCNEGYTLSGTICIASESPLKTQANSVQSVSSISQIFGSIISAGSSLFSLTKIVSKIVQNTRYINLTVTNELADIYQTWDTDMISWQVPNGFSRLDHFKALPYLFSRYELESSFLMNFWPTLITTIVGSAAFIACFGLKLVFVRRNYKGWVSAFLQKLVLGTFNFTLIQVYGCLDDTLFYLSLDAKTNPFNSSFAWASLIFAFIFLAVGCLLVFFNFWTVKKYQRIKSQKNTEDLNAFNEKNQYWELFYSDFSDNDFWSQSFLALIIIRSSISSLIIAILYVFPIVQTTCLVMFDGAVVLFLLKKKPFNTLQGKTAQYYFETITLLVHVCTFILSLEPSSEILRPFSSKSIIYLNTALVTGSIAFMFLEIFEAIKEKIQSEQLKKDDNIALKNAPEETSEAQNPPSSARLMTNTIETQRKSDLANSEKTELFESSHPLSRLNSKKNLSISRLDTGPFQPLDLILNAENSVISDFNTSNLMNGERDQSSLPIIVRRKSLFAKQKNRNSSMMKSHAICPESFENT